MAKPTTPATAATTRLFSGLKSRSSHRDLLSQAPCERAGPAPLTRRTEHFLPPHSLARKSPSSCVSPPADPNEEHPRAALLGTVGCSPAEETRPQLSGNVAVSLCISLLAIVFFGTCWLFSAKFEQRSPRCLFLPRFVPAGAGVCSPTGLPDLKGRAMKLSLHQMLENLHRESCWQTASAAVLFFSAVISYFT